MSAADQREANEGREEGEDEGNYNDSDYAAYHAARYGGAAASSQDEVVVIGSEGFRNAQEAGVERHMKRTKVVDPTPMDVDKPETDDEEEEWNREEIDGLFCPICMEGWTIGGDHQVCCIPCGHIYGMSCIKKWLDQLGSRGKCPQCNKKCKLKDVRLLYASRIVAVDEKLQKEVRSLESKCASLEKKDADWSRKEYEWQKIERDLHAQMQNLRERTSYLDGLLKDAQARNSELSSKSCLQEHVIYGNSFDAECGTQGCPNGFILLRDLQVAGARLFDVDTHSQTLIIARRLSGMGGRYTLTKISLLPPHERENIQLPVSTKVVKDLRVSPHARLALLASLGKKLFVYSTESSNTVLTYDLPTAAWSCAWDVNNSHYLYAGLQNGMMSEFDLRQTSRPVESITGLTGNPIHTVHSLSADSVTSWGSRSVLTASSGGLCHWNFESSGEKSFLIPESVDQGVCISLAYGPGSGDIVASFRPRIEMEGPLSLSQAQTTQSSSLLGQTVEGRHVYYRIVGRGSNSSGRYEKIGATSANVNYIRLPRSAIIDSRTSSSQNSCLAAADEATCDLVLQQLPSLKVIQRMKSLKHPIRDVKYSRILNSELLSCLSEETVLLFSRLSDRP